MRPPICKILRPHYSIRKRRFPLVLSNNAQRGRGSIALAPGLALQARYPCASLPSAPSSCVVWAALAVGGVLSLAAVPTPCAGAVAAFWAVNPSSMRRLWSVAMVCRRRQNGESPKSREPLPAPLWPVAFCQFFGDKPSPDHRQTFPTMLWPAKERSRGDRGFYGVRYLVIPRKILYRVSGGKADRTRTAVPKTRYNE